MRPGFLRRASPLRVVPLRRGGSSRGGRGARSSAVTLGRRHSQSEIRAAKPGHVLRIYPQIGGASSNAKAYPHPLSLDRLRRRADRGIRHRHLSGRPGAARGPQHHCLGALHDRRRPTLRADVAPRSLRHDRRPRRHAGARLRRGRDRLRGPRRSRRASLSRRGQRGACGAGQRARRARAPRRAGHQIASRCGAIRRAACGTVHRRACSPVRARN